MTDDIERVFEDAFKLMCGDLLGEGTYRKVFACTFDATLVVKVEQQTHAFHNVQEWRTWDESQYWKDGAKWLAPCVAISPNGRVMLQKRTEPVRPADLPKLVPSFFRDIKLENMGMLNGRVVCHDYAYVASVLPLRLKKANW